MILWFAWLVLTFGFFSGSRFLNSYYTAALIPAVAALCGMGFAAAWHRRRTRAVRGALAALVAATVAVTVALVPGYVGVRPWIIASSVFVGLLAVGILVASLRAGHDTVWAVAVGPVLAGAAMLLGSAWASSVVVAATLSPFDSPYAPVSVNRDSQEAAARFPADQAALEEFVAKIPASQAADVFETSALAGYDIMATGHEFLSVGGFTGRVPAPPLAEFTQFVADGHVVRVTVTTHPMTRTPDLRWVVSHCARRVRANTTSSSKPPGRSSSVALAGRPAEGATRSPGGPRGPPPPRRRGSAGASSWDRGRPRPTSRCPPG